MLKIFSLIEFGERAGSGLSGICKRWEKVYHTPVTIEETHKDGVDRTILTLSTGGHEQDIRAMLELYSDLIDTPEPQTDLDATQANPKSDQKTTQSDGNTTQTTTQSNQETTQKKDHITQITTQSDQKITQKEAHTTQTAPQQSLTIQEQIIIELRKNPNRSRKDLAKLIPSVTEDGIKYHLKKLQDKGLIRRVGANFGGHWEVLVND